MLSFLTSSFSLSDILTDIGSIVTSAIGWCTSFVNEISSSPLLLFFTLLSVSLFGIHIMKSLMSN